jgi:archaellum component FlaC
MSKQSDTTEAAKFYEETARLALAGQLLQAFGVHICPGEEGFNRSFKPTTATFQWPQTVQTSEVKVKFWGLCNNWIASINPQLRYSPSTSSNLELTSSHHHAHLAKGKNRMKIEPKMKTTQRRRPIEVREGESICDARKFAVFEISSGTFETLKSKVPQLEKALQIALAKAGASDVLHAVGMCGIVGSVKVEEELMKYIATKKGEFHLVKRLFEFGRFVYVFNGNTVNQMVKGLCSRVEELFDGISTEIDGVKLGFDTKIEEVGAQIKQEFGTRVDEVVTRIDEVKQEVVTRIDEVKQEVGTRIDEVLTRIDEVKQEVLTRIDEVKQELGILSSRISDLMSTFPAKKGHQGGKRRNNVAASKN